jgi:hypothetical protein
MFSKVLSACLVRIVSLTLTLTLAQLLAVSVAFAADSEGGIKESAAEISAAKVKQIAEISGVDRVMLELKAIQAELNQSQSPVGSRRESLINRLIYLRGQLVQYLETSSLEVNASKASVELAMAKVDDARAKIVEHRARVLKRNSIVNFVSGGVTKMVGYSIALADINLPTNLLEIVDGGIQSALSGMAMKEQEEEKHFSQSVPSLLLTVINGNNSETHDYPRGVWNYLDSRALGGEAIISDTGDLAAVTSGKPVPVKTLKNGVIAGGADITVGSPTETRREKLLAAWAASGMIDRHTTVKQKGLGISSRLCAAKNFTAQLLEDRAAMLSDLKSVVSQMNNSLMQLSQMIKDSYRDDPAF